MSEPATARRVTFRDVFANREFRAIYVAQALSVVGDQLARIAVASWSSRTRTRRSYRGKLRSLLPPLGRSAARSCPATPTGSAAATS